MVKEVYLDNSATTKPYKDVVNLMGSILDYEYGNPSSTHFKGFNVSDLIFNARNIIATSLDVDQSEIYFTSGGTEGNNIAIIGAANANCHKGRHIITSVIEHPSVLNTFNYLKKNGYDVEFINVDNKGFIDIDEIKKAIRNDTIMISIMYVNNEIGTIQPIREISDIIKQKNRNIIFHVDAVQAYGKINVYPIKLGIDLLTISAHKIHGPKGVGALYIRNGIKISPILFGGGQEKSIRPGTENVSAICGFGKAVEITFTDVQIKNEKIEKLKKYLKNRLLDLPTDVVINTPNNDLLVSDEVKMKAAPHILNVSFKDITANGVVEKLSLKGIYVSTRSACSCNKKAYSHVLKNIGLTDELINGTIRFSFSYFNTAEEIEYVIETLKSILDL